MSRVVVAHVTLALWLAAVGCTARVAPVTHLPAYLNSSACRDGPTVPQSPYTGQIFVGADSFPDNMTAAELVAAGAIVTEPGNYLPFEMTRGIYTSEWLMEYDALMYRWYTSCRHDEFERAFIAQYDGVVAGKLKEMYRGRQVVGVMGGWLLRDDPMYVECAVMCRNLALEGYVVATGGGPGVMECCNLGSKMSIYTDAEFQDALAVLATSPSYYVDAANGYPAVKAVLQRYPNSTDKALGVSDWTWPGHNFFCKYQAKMFDDYYREEQLVGLNTAGVIFFTDGATAGYGSQDVGTYLELAVQVLIGGASSERGNQFSTPMVFYGRPWLANGLYQTFMNQMQRRRETMRDSRADNASAPNPRVHMSNKIFFADDYSGVVGPIVNFTKQYYPSPAFNASQGAAPEYPFPPMPAKAAVPPPTGDDAALLAAATAAAQLLVTADGMHIAVGCGTAVKYFIGAAKAILTANAWHMTVVPATYRARDELNLYRMNTWTNEVNYTNITVTAVMDERAIIAPNGTLLLDAAVVQASAATRGTLNPIVFGGATVDASPLQEALIMQTAATAVALGRADDVVPDVSAAAPLPLEVPATVARAMHRQLAQRAAVSGLKQRMIDNGMPTVLPVVTPIVSDANNFVFDAQTWSTARIGAVAATAGVLGLGVGAANVGVFGFSNGTVTLLHGQR